jgi:hypothetical protein
MKLLLVAFIAGFSFFQQNQKEKCTISSIKVISVNEGILINGVIDFDCEVFDKAFSEEKDTFYIRSHKYHNEIAAYINSGKPIAAGLDVRAKMFINYSTGKTDTICMGEMPTFSINGKLMTLNESSLKDILFYYKHKEEKDNRTLPSGKKSSQR